MDTKRSKEYVCFNGGYFDAQIEVLSHKNRAFYYGDALFETIHCLGTEPQFFEDHWERLLHGASLLKFELSGNLSKSQLKKHIVSLLNKNRIFGGAKVRLTVFRKQGGLYAPDSNKIEWLIDPSPLSVDKYELNKPGLKIGLFTDHQKPINNFSTIKSTNALPFVMAGVYKNERSLDECLLLNTKGRIVESISSNVFLYINDGLYTPPLSEGCLNGVARKNIIRIANKIGNRVIEKPMEPEELLSADEIFLTNAIQGIKWVGGYEKKRYFNFLARKLIIELNNSAFE